MLKFVENCHRFLARRNIIGKNIHKQNRIRVSENGKRLYAVLDQAMDFCGSGLPTICASLSTTPIAAAAAAEITITTTYLRPWR